MAALGMVGWWLAGVMTVAPGPRVVSALEKVRPGVSLAGEKEARLSLARGECEGAQVVLPPGVSRVQVAPLALRGPGTALQASVWREDFLEVKTPSNSQGGTGAWPDPLVPVEAGIDTARSIPGAELLVVEGMGHDLPREVWPRIAGAIAANAARASPAR